MTKKITIVSHDMLWPFKGGGAVRIIWIVKTLLEKGYNISLIAPILNENEFINHFKLKKTLKIYNLGNIHRFQKGKEFLYIKLGFKIFINLLKVDSNIVYAHNIVSAFPSFIFTRIKKIDLVYDIDDITMGLSKFKLIKKYGPLIEYYVAKKSEKLITMSKSLANFLINKGVKNKFLIAPHGVDFKIFNNQHQKRKNWILYMGGMESHDGVDLIPSAAKIVLKNYPDYKFVFVGDGSQLEKLKHEVKKYGLEKSFIFYSWVNQDKLAEIVNKAKIGLVTHHYSLACDIALVLKGLEYMACGLAVIAPNLKGMVEEIGENNQRGLIFETSNYEDLSEKINLVIKNYKENDVGEKFVRRNHDWMVISKKISNYILS